MAKTAPAAQRAGQGQIEMPDVAPSASRAELWVLQGVLVAATLVYSGRLLDSHGIPKVTVMAVGAVALIGLAAADVVNRGVLTVRRTPALAALAVFVLMGLVTTIASDDVWRSIIGQRGRGTGLVAYLLVALFFVVVSARAGAREVDGIVRAITVAGVVVALYGLSQRLGIVDVSAELAPVFGNRAVIATLGNPNFVSGFLGICLPLTVWWALGAPRTQRRLLEGAGAAAVIELALLAARSVQGVLAGAIGVALPLAFLAWQSAVPAVRRRVLAGLALLTLMAVLVVGLGLSGRGPLGHQLDDVGRRQRLEFWRAGFEMAKDEPVLGVGFDRFGSYYRAYRTPEAARQFGITDTTDEPHSVPLAMLSGGGLLLGLAYFAFVATVGLLLLRGLRRTEGSTQLLLLGVGGAWVAYQVQSAVSIDVPPLPLLHFVLAGCIVAMTVPPTEVWRAARLRRGRAGRRHHNDRSGARSVAPIAIGLTCLLAAWFATRPLRAELSAAAAFDAASKGSGNTAVDRMRHAHELVPWEPVYDAQTGRLLLDADRQDLALPYYKRAAERDPRNLTFVLPYARLLGGAQQWDEGRRWYDRARALEPAALELKVEVAKFELGANRPDVALSLLESVLAVRPDDAQVHLALGDAYYLKGQQDRADLEYARSLGLVPTDTATRERVADLYMRRKQAEKAIPLFQQLLETAPMTVAWLDKLGAAYEATGQRDDAVAAYNQALALTRNRDEPARAALQRLGITPPVPT